MEKNRALDSPKAPKEALVKRPRKKKMRVTELMLKEEDEVSIVGGSSPGLRRSTRRRTAIIRN